MKIKVDVTQAVKGRIGQPIANLDSPSVDGKVPDMTLRDVIVNSIDNPQKSDGNMSMAKILELHEIAKAVTLNDTVELTAEDWSKVKARIASSLYPIHVKGAACDLMQPAKGE